MPNDEGPKIEKEETSPGGIGVEPTEGEIPPPLGEGEEIPEEVPEAKRVTGKIPLSPAVIKPFFRGEGIAIAEHTGYPGWLYREDELEGLCELIEQCGVEMKPQFQVLISIGTMHVTRIIGQRIWERKGRPGDIRQRTGEKPAEQKPGEETRV